MVINLGPSEDRGRNLVVFQLVHALLNVRLPLNPRFRLQMLVCSELQCSLRKLGLGVRVRVRIRVRVKFRVRFRVGVRVRVRIRFSVRDMVKNRIRVYRKDLGVGGQHRVPAVQDCRSR